MGKDRGYGGTAISHSKEQLSLAYIQSLVAVTGINALEPKIDNYGIDITLIGKNFPGSFCDEPQLAAQLKCAQWSAIKLDGSSKELVYQLPAKNFNKLVTRGMLPKILVVHVAPNNATDWIHFNRIGFTIRHASYWVSLSDRDQTTQKSISVRIPLTQQLTPTSLIWMMTRISNGEQLFNCGGKYDD
ncbi:MULTISPECIES: DUF4365 domain-containing protein [Vibrio]|uniref:DUF4365 domain-containing protein n=1 Tax=Vibrio TaxID=662 RepID=UPI00192F4AC5|nr:MULTISPECIES: DUF4365 domain-containing protein [Vibrio]MBE3670966.1 hypothetical protein [Vibrio navarrensis]MCG6229747.1 DUF4365 domain-containing protein [Vibrio furnissii]MCG6372817.1 DUF4365 domain-containing protein [Vibrio fluvialis]